MTADLIVYRSTHPDVLASWMAASERRAEESEALRSFAHDVDPDRERTIIISNGFGISILGLSHEVGWPVPRCWRTRERGGVLYIWPVRSTKTGNAADQRMRELKPSDPRDMLAREHGMADSFLSGNRWLTPGVREMGGALWITWSAEPTEQPDPVKWERMPLSAYYAAVEAADATEDAAS